MTTPYPAACSVRNCVWYRGSVGPPFDPTHVCDAFPLGIPQEIVVGVNLHESSMDGDEGIVYMPAGVQLKHLPGQHDQSTHTPKAYRGGAELVYYDPEEMQDLGDPWGVADEAGLYISSDKDAARVAIVDDQIVGALFEAVDVNNQTYSADIAVLPEYQGRGIGSQLADATIENFRDHQADFDLTMEIDAINPKAVEMLERRGAEVVGTTAHHIQMRLKHQAGRHDQKRHDPTKGDVGFPNASEVRFNTSDAEQRVGEVLALLPDKARELITNTSAPISFWSPPSKGSGSYTYSGGHRIAFSDDSSGLEEFGHALDKELGLQRGQRAEYSRSKEWQSIVKAQPRRIGALYDVGKATENFGWSFKDYVERPDWLAEQYPQHYTKMEELFGG